MKDDKKKNRWKRGEFRALRIDGYWPALSCLGLSASSVFLAVFQGFRK